MAKLTNTAHANPTPACERVQARLPDLADGALAKLDEARDRGHLEACAPCRDALVLHERLLGTIRAAASEGTEIDAAQVAGAVLARIGPSPMARRHTLALWRRTPAMRGWALGLAAAAAAVLMLALLEKRVGFAAGFGQRAALERVFVELPRWSDVVRGLGSLSRGLS
ncbi:MAG: zf-HC2 domain-containing protein [Planctomycetes bacterium]|nr:zf-HC2 domain-containing protein [Planctomycetota bacterium]